MRGLASACAAVTATRLIVRCPHAVLVSPQRRFAGSSGGCRALCGWFRPCWAKPRGRTVSLWPRLVFVCDTGRPLRSDHL